MTRRLMPLAVALALIAVPATAAQAQDEGPDAADAAPLSVEVTISRYRGDELLGRRPYVLAVTAGGDSSTLRVGGDVPVPVTTWGRDASEPHTIFNYQSMEVVIECSARRTGEGRYETAVSIDEDLLGGPSADTFIAPDTPFFRRFSSRVTLPLRDGQSRRYVAATDPISGDTIQVDVTLTVLD